MLSEPTLGQLVFIECNACFTFMKNSSSSIARTEVSVSALITSSIALCASSVPADFVNAGVWLPPPGSVGIAIAVMNFKAVQIVFSLTISWM